MESNFIFTVSKGGYFGEVFGELIGGFLDLLTRFTIKLIFHSSKCSPSCEQTVSTWVVIVLIWLIVIATYFLFRTTKKRRRKNRK